MKLAPSAVDAFPEKARSGEQSHKLWAQTSTEI
jgi:hypothetical protein